MVSELAESELSDTSGAAPTAQASVVPESTTDVHLLRRFDLTTQTAEGLEAAAEALAAGRLVVLPTDTVYGIAADALQPAAVQALLDAKRRSRDMPPPVLIAEPAMLRALVTEVSVEVDALVNRFWPGALTLIMKAQSSLRMDLGRTEGMIAVRVPGNADARALLRQTGPLAVSSANLSGQPPAINIDEAIAQLGESVAVYLDGGPTPGMIASTIVDLASTPKGRLVRAGVIGHTELAQVLPELADLPVAEPDALHVNDTTQSAAEDDMENDGSDAAQPAADSGSQQSANQSANQSAPRVGEVDPMTDSDSSTPVQIASAEAPNA